MGKRINDLQVINNDIDFNCKTIISKDNATYSTTISNILQIVYPINSIYITANDINPSILFGFGEWEQIKDRFLLAAGDVYGAGSTGGEAEHILSIQEMPSHLHNISSTLMWANKTGDVQGGTNTYYARSDKQTTQLAGGGQPHNNMPPYLTVYMWKRIK